MTMYLLAIESSCDETAAAVIRAEGDRLTVLADVIASQIDIHRLYGTNQNRFQASLANFCP